MKTPIIFNTSLIANLPIASAWNYLTDPAFLISLDPKTRIKSVQNSGPMTPGAVVIVRLKYGQVSLHVDEVMPNHKFVFHYNSFPAQKVTCEYVFTSISDKETRVAVKTELRLLLPIFFRIFRRSIEKAMIANFEAVLRKAEKMHVSDG